MRGILNWVFRKRKEGCGKSVESGWNDRDKRELGIRDRKVKASDVIQKKAEMWGEKVWRDIKIKS